MHITHTFHFPQSGVRYKTNEGNTMNDVEGDTPLRINSYFTNISRFHGTLFVPTATQNLSRVAAKPRHFIKEFNLFDVGFRKIDTTHFLYFILDCHRPGTTGNCKVMLSPPARCGGEGVKAKGVVCVAKAHKFTAQEHQQQTRGYDSS